MSGSGATQVRRAVSVGAGTVGLPLVDVSSQPDAAIEILDDDFAAGIDAAKFGSIKFAVQEEKQLVATTLPAGDHLDDLLATSFSDCKEDSSDSWQVSGVDDAMEDKLSDVLSEQFDKYLMQFNQSSQQQGFVGIDDDLESFDNLFPGLGFN